MAILDRSLRVLLDMSRAGADHSAQLICSCLSELHALAQDALPPEHEWSIASFGSTANGFGTRGSDLDVTLYQDPIDPYALPGDSVPALKQLRKVLQRSGDFVVKLSLFRARTPVLKLQYLEELDVDLSVNNVAPLPNTRLLRAYAAMGSCVADLGVAVKLWAKGCGLCGAASGHLSAYALLLMTIYFLQVASPNRIPCLQRGGENDHAFDDDESAAALAQAAGCCFDASLAVLLCAFFDFYSSDFAWGTEVVSVRLGRREDVNSGEFILLPGREDDRLSVEDPFELSRNLRDVLVFRKEQELREAFRAASEAGRAGRHLEIWLQMAGSSVLPLEVGATSVAPWDLESKGHGYLALQEGECVKVLHAGSELDVEERGWLFGRAGDRRGWLPRTAVLPRVVGENTVEIPPPVRSVPAPGPEPLGATVALTFVQSSHQGYLALVAGEDVLVDYLGSELNEDERNWLYGRAAAGSGWFPQAAVAPITFYVASKASSRNRDVHDEAAASKHMKPNCAAPTRPCPLPTDA
eukprot:CAMPEP_0117464348 /NCGR_PEP_ID=MMETSP0784-20121206/4053_1 /TAXON_ID=39447 /ORGANISM="" /LENGTH=524 /DNA_ID=CAMNT_0005258201 /DNA_START=82 /DNA_END=1656 /DNA_ORIENTATION=+